MKSFTTKIILGVVGLFVLVTVLWGFGTYNSLVKQNLAVDAQWSKVETQYQRRFDLIPNLVASVQGIFTQEKDVFTAIADARTRYSGATSVDEKARAAGQVESALGRLLVITENYPQLQSNQSVQNLMTQLEGTENRVSVERNRFNEEVQSYNSLVLTFPAKMIASIFGFNVREFFKATVGADTAPAVKFN